jgi:anthranilate synthase component 1
MYNPALDELDELATKGNLVPIWRELPADLETPVSVFLKLRGQGSSFLLESVEKGEQLGRYSFLGIEPAGLLTAQNGEVSVWQDGSEQQHSTHEGDPLVIAEQMLSRYQPVPVNGLPRFYGGLVGYLGYDAVRFFERVPLAARPGIDLPDAVFMLADSMVIFDHVKHRLLVVVNAHIDPDPAAGYQAATDRIEAIISRLRQPLSFSHQATPCGDANTGRWESNLEKAKFETMVRSAKKYIAAGDIFQVVLSQRLSRCTGADPFAIYRALRMLNPSPYMFYLELPDNVRLIGSSPEVLVRLEGRRAEVRPIAGTRPRGANPAEDEALAEELLADPKERAEHVMLVDLGRNDLGRVCRYGSVQMQEMMVIERYSHVMHIVSDVQGELDPDLGAFDLLRATFPAGTVSGAPKVRAMEIIAELEGIQRAHYAGAVGYLGYSGNMDTCITIRTIAMKDDTAYVQAGAGIVADSDPTREYYETLQKAQALAEAVDRAERGDL